MFFQRVKTKGLGHNAYILGCGEGVAVVVDPRRDVAQYLQIAHENNLRITHVFETHRQEDFEFVSRALAQICDAKIVAGTHALFGQSDLPLADGQALTVGTTRLVALATPGHTPESTCYAAFPKDTGDKCWGVFTGDTLFVGDTGRTDLSDPDKTGENAGVLYDSVHTKIAPLGDQALVLPAHGSGSACGGNISDRDDTTLGIEKDTNPVFKKARLEFIGLKVSEHLPRPPYFVHMEQVNLGGGRVLPGAVGDRTLTPHNLEKRMQEGIVIDTRRPDAFAGAHIGGSYNIWLDGLSSFGGWFADERTVTFLVVQAADDAPTAIAALARIGIDSVEGILVRGVDAWREAGLPIESLGTTSVPGGRGMAQRRPLIHSRCAGRYGVGEIAHPGGSPYLCRLPREATPANSERPAHRG